MFSINCSNNKCIPRRAFPYDTGMDLYANINKEILISPGSCELMPTGVSLQIPRINKLFNNILSFLFGFKLVYDVQIRSRSGLACKCVFVANSPGTIDTDYVGSLSVVLYNGSKDVIEISPYQRIAQLVISIALIPTRYKINNSIVTYDQEDTLFSVNRTVNGFGSSDNFGLLFYDISDLIDDKATE